MKKTILSTLLVAVFGLFSLVSFSQGTVKGKVVDAESNEGHIGASVVLKGTTIGIVTDINGDFSLSVEAGDQKITISYIGYISQELNAKIIRGRANDLGDISLESDAVGINESVVSAARACSRRTCVADTKLAPPLIAEKLGTQE